VFSAKHYSSVSLVIMLRAVWPE